MTDKARKLLILNLPYVILGLIATNFGEAWRLAEGGYFRETAGIVRDSSSGFPESPSQLSSAGSFDWADVRGGSADCCISAGEECEEIPP